ncbi:MAG: hypothetical protein EBW47_09410, partial [Betaproteobacteria bacterium]|nr:hypothetical protein [Betaproteobacteria bacterium]
MILPDTFQAASDEMPAAADPANQSHCFFFYRGSLLVRQDAIAASQRLAHWPVSQADIEALIASPVHPERASPGCRSIEDFEPAGRPLRG